MRVHGNKAICRRKDTPIQSDYKKYKPYLQSDFCHICGYCGKHEMVSHKGMEPDHFVPAAIDHSRRCDYSNLVYSCFTCNRKKLGKWPTKDKDKPHDGHVGFIDPADKEYDKHLGRSSDETMEYYTDVGRYMFEKAFKFDIRPTRIIWKASYLYELNQKLGCQVNLLPEAEQKKYIEAMVELDSLQQYLFANEE